MRDVIDVLECVKECSHFHNENFWQRMMEKIVRLRSQLTVRDILDIVSLY